MLEFQLDLNGVGLISEGYNALNHDFFFPFIRFKSDMLCKRERN